MVVYLENEKDFAELTKKGKVLVDFFADWCGPCRMINPILDEVAREKKHITILKVDVDTFGSLAQLFNVFSVPTLKLFNNGKDVGTRVGYITKAKLLQFIK